MEIAIIIVLTSLITFIVTTINFYRKSAYGLFSVQAFENEEGLTGYDVHIRMSSKDIRDNTRKIILYRSQE